MRTPRLAAAGAVSGAVIVALAAPVYAAPAAEPKVTVKEKTFTPGDNLTMTITGCEGRPQSNIVAGKNEIFAEYPVFTRKGAGWEDIEATRTDLKPGAPATTKIMCQTGSGLKTFELTVTPPLPKPKTSPTKPGFEFGFDKVKLSTRTVTANGKIEFTVTCPTSVTAESASFSSAPAFTKSGTDTFKGTGTFKSTLPSVVTIKVTCKSHGSVTYSTKPGNNSIGDGGPKIPKGAPNTGDGSTLTGGGGSLALGGGALVLLAGAGLGAVALRRRAKGAEENA